MFNRSVSLRGLVLLAGACAFSNAMWADGPEIVGFGGGATYSGGNGTHALFGGGASFGIGNNIRLLGEFTYSPLASATQSQSGVTVSGSEHLIGFGGGIDYSFLDAKAKARPYVTAVVGLDHDSASATGTGSSAGSIPSISISSNSAYIGFGGGLRYFIGKSWGIKPEVRYQHSPSFGNSVVYSVGLFYRFGD